MEARRRGVALDAERISFGWGGRPLFDEVTLGLASGEMVGLIGSNGSGKTTLLRILSGTLRPQAGEARCDGAPLVAMPARARARRIGVVPQENHLTFDFTAMEVVLMGRAAHLGFLGVEGVEDHAAARRAMERTGTIGFADRMVAHLSGGERQLVFVARALAQEPGAILLDEPTAFLDIRHRLEIYAVLRERNRSEGLTVLTTSHDINLAARFCPRLVLLKRGRIVADGPTRDVFRDEILSDVYETPLRVIRDEATGEPYALPVAPLNGPP